MVLQGKVGGLVSPQKLGDMLLVNKYLCHKQLSLGT